MLEQMVINSDFESQGDGTLTVVATKTISSSNSPLLITAWDLDIDGILNAGSEAMTVHAAQVNQGIGLGNTASDMHLTDPEIGNIQTTAGLTVGSSSNGDIVINGLSATNVLVLL